MFDFLKKQTKRAIAEVLENGEAKANAFMSRIGGYEGAEVFVDVAVRVQPDDGPPFEAVMKAGLLKCFLIKPGVRVMVEYDSRRKENVKLADELPAILERNPQLKK
jgi:hypothetical protein